MKHSRFGALLLVLSLAGCNDPGQQLHAQADHEITDSMRKSILINGQRELGRQSSKQEMSQQIRKPSDCVSELQRNYR